MPSPDWTGQTLCVLYPFFFSANSVATVGVRVYGWLRHSRWSHPFRHLPFSKEVSHESVAGRPLWIRFTSTPCSFFELYVHCVRGLKRRFAWQVQRTSRTFSSTWQAWQFLHVAKMFAGVGQHERWFWRSCLVAGAVFRWTTFWKVRKHRFVKLSSVLISNMMIPCGGTSDASGSFFVAGAVLCRPRHKSGWDLGKRRCWHFWCSFFHGACYVLWISNMCSRNLLVALCMSDRSRCGPVLRLLAQPSRHSVWVRLLSLWRGANFAIAQSSRHLGPVRSLLLCRGIFFLRSLRHFARVRSLSLWRGARFIESRRSCAEILTRRSFVESLRRDLDKRCLACAEILPGEFF